MSELKRCECGGHAETYDYEYGESDPCTAWGCRCGKCESAVSGYDTEEQAVEVWNRRADDRD